MARNSIESHEETARWEVQLRKGVLEFAILLTLRGGEHYGFEYYTLTPRGVVLLEAMIPRWKQLSTSVEGLLAGEEND